MEKDTEKTRVCFKKSQNPYTKEWEVLVVFIDEDWDTSSTSFMSYMHIGQHSECDKVYANECPLATEEEYAPLKKELEDGFGYNLEVVNHL